MIRAFLQSESKTLRKIIKILLFFLLAFLLICGLVAICSHSLGFTPRKVPRVDRNCVYSADGRIYFWTSGKIKYTAVRARNGSELSANIVPFYLAEKILYYWSADDHSIGIKIGDKTEWHSLHAGYIGQNESVKRLVVADNAVYLNLVDGSGKMCGIAALDLRSHKFSRPKGVMSIRTCLVSGVWQKAIIRTDNTLHVTTPKNRTISTISSAIRDWDYNFSNGDFYWIDQHHQGVWRLSVPETKTKLLTPFLTSANAVIWQSASNELWLPLEITMSAGNGIAIYKPDGKLVWMRMDKLHPVSCYAQQYPYHQIK